MKLCITICLLSMAACAAFMPSSKNVDDTKARVLKLVEERKSDSKWMAIAECPLDKMPDAGRRPETSSDSCASDPQKCLEQCDLKNADSCYALAGLVQKHDSEKSEVADVLYQLSCEMGIVSGCTNRAATMFDKEDDVSISCAAGTFEKSCKLDDPWGCSMHGLALGAGIGREQNIDAAYHALDKACDVSVDKAGEACSRAKELKQSFQRQNN